ncbi:hypothetical protein MRB53_035787 [Persea americana]|uniref:Uncharacterized protein n=1 Tax=Persea americana TaxID=3435 RepID=A0ACC2K5M9_PERAE|nr:hypothetical protein MRB53_035787 [Persea americana]
MTGTGCVIRMRQDYRDDVGGVPSMSADIALTEEQFPLMDGRYSYYMGRGRQSVYSLLTALCFFFYKVNGESFLFVTKQIVWWISWARPQKRKVSRVDLLSAMQCRMQIGEEICLKIFISLGLVSFCCLQNATTTAK